MLYAESIEADVPSPSHSVAAGMRNEETRFRRGVFEAAC